MLYTPVPPLRRVLKKTTLFVLISTILIRGAKAIGQYAKQRAY